MILFVLFGSKREEFSRQLEEIAPKIHFDRNMTIDDMLSVTHSDIQVIAETGAQALCWSLQLDMCDTKLATYLRGLPCFTSIHLIYCE